MLELLKAGQDYQQAVDMTVEFIRAQSERVRCGEITKEQAFDSMVLSTELRFLLSDPDHSTLVLTLEAKHFAKFSRQNARRAVKLRENRECDRLGIPRPDRGASSAPRTIRGPRPELKPSVLQTTQRLAATAHHEPRSQMGKWAEQAAAHRPPEIGADDDFIVENESSTVPASNALPVLPEPETRPDLDLEIAALLKKREGDAEILSSLGLDAEGKLKSDKPE